MGALTLDWLSVAGLQDPKGAKSLDQIQNKPLDCYLSPTCIKLKNSHHLRKQLKQTC